ncbi:MAG: hypothetical protein HOP04_02220 [Methylophilaceae bacterium]|nr:hypothetical protein [Methylophilaceae bacterium]
MVKPVMSKSNKTKPVLKKLDFEGQEVNVLMRDAMPWFDAADVCAVLGYVHVLQTMDDQVDDEDRLQLKMDGKLVGKTSKVFINTSGLYALILGNGKPKTKRFKRWITIEVLPSLAIKPVENHVMVSDVNHDKPIIGEKGVTKRDVGVASKSQMQLAFDNLPVRIEMDNGVAWFCAEDVCAVLGYVNSRKTVDDHCRLKGVTKRDTLTAGGMQVMSFINEPNLYRLIMKSRKPEAEKFESWVMEEVLPTIRRTGGYQIPAPLPQIQSPGGKQYQQVGPYVLNSALFARLFYALDKKLGCAALIYQLLRMEALDKWVVATIREISKGMDHAICSATVHKYSKELQEQGLIELQMRLDAGPKTSMFKISSEELALFLQAFPESVDLRPGMDWVSADGELVTLH